MTNTVNNGIPFVPENTLDPAAGLNLSLVTIDALLQLAVIDLLVDTPPGSPADGDRYIVGTSPSGDWAGQANKLARWDGTVWQFYDSVLALNLTDGALYKFTSGSWTELTSTTASDWTQLNQTPSSFTGFAGQITRVTSGEDALEFVTVAVALLGSLTGNAGKVLQVNSAEDGVEMVTSRDLGSGTTANRPASPILVGSYYFDTDLGQPVWWDGTGYVDATGASA